ncbi:hypothetical protein [Aquimarina sp. SS2-1]|uniref:hypothetical protein n=1 Tax=Aquimarina besae TaxID=3342247 RepID=UPI00366E43D0
MQSINDLKPNLPLTFQKVEIKRSEGTKPHKTITVAYIDTDAMTPYSFYRPISKMILL